MNIWTGIFLIAAAAVVGCLYLDKIRKVHKLQELLHFAGGRDIMEDANASVVWISIEKEKMIKDLEEIRAGLGKGSINLRRRYDFKWGVAYEFDNDYIVYYCNPSIEIPKIRASMALLSDKLNCEQAVEILNVNQEFVRVIHLYDED